MMYIYNIYNDLSVCISAHADVHGMSCDRVKFSSGEASAGLRAAEAAAGLPRLGGPPRSGGGLVRLLRGAQARPGVGFGFAWGVGGFWFGVLFVLDLADFVFRCCFG